MAALSESRSDYCIISLDLNGLKEVNDKYGHVAGDRYLKEFTGAFRASFEDTAFQSRLGGDEFMVIIRNAKEEDVKASLSKLTGALDVMNALYPDFRRSVACGYAFRHEIEVQPRLAKTAGARQPTWYTDWPTSVCTPIRSVSMRSWVSGTSECKD